VRVEGNKFIINNPIDNGKCQGSISTNIKGVNRFVFIHPPGEPSVKNCIEKWDYGCTKDSDCCDNEKCVKIYPEKKKKCGCVPKWSYGCTKDSECCEGNCIKFGNESMKKCGCIALWDWGCNKNSDCCDKKCHTSGNEKGKCYK
jgi:hypothetical protein